jgi:hypothetical protein
VTVHEPAIPLAGARAFGRAARRTLALRAVLAAAALAAAAAAVLAARAPAESVALLPARSDGIVVLDLSASISSDTYARIGATLHRLAESRGRYGLVLFSDTAYLSLPPGTPAAELRPFERFFAVAQQTGPGLLPEPAASPWTDVFSAGTKISAGLQLALATIRSQHLRRPAVLLVSDLDDDVGDRERLTTTALALRQIGVTVRVVGLNPAPEDARFVQQLLRRRIDLTRAPLPGEQASGRATALPTGLILAAAAAAALLALRELLTVRLRWREA